MITLNHYLIFSTLLFTVGMSGVLLRKNLIIVLASIELMLNAANLSFVAISKYLNILDGQIAYLIVMTIAAAEVAVGLSIVLYIYFKTGSINIDLFDRLKG